MCCLRSWRTKGKKEIRQFLGMRRISFRRANARSAAARWNRKRVDDALEGMMVEEWPGYHLAMELQLPEPEPVRCAEEAEAADGEQDTDRERPAKRRKVVAEAAGQECSVCFELLESDLAVWPGCSLPHVFHGACLELTLKGNEMCPIRRRKLSATR